MKKCNFREGDTVYHFRYGEGAVMWVREGEPYPIKVRFVTHSDVSFTADGIDKLNEPPTLSLKPYDFVNGGFSQERPLEKDTLVYVRLIKGEGQWYMKYFSRFKNGVLYAFNDQLTSKQTNSDTGWEEYSLTNPLEKKE